MLTYHLCHLQVVDASKESFLDMNRNIIAQVGYLVEMSRSINIRI